MNDEFPLKETSSIYMSGEQLYNIVQYDKPGFRYATTMFPVEAQEIRDVVSDALEEAEQRGAERAFDEAVEEIASMEGNRMILARYKHLNPYRADLMEGDDE